MSVVAIIQARMGSTRLPGKVLKQIGNDTMLAQAVNRTKRASSLSKVVIATTVKEKDDDIVTECNRIGVEVFRGDEDDVLDRYYQAANAHQVQTIVRITSDCPLIEPEVIDRVVNAYQVEKPDYASNFAKRTYPRGLDVEIMSFDTLKTAWQKASEFPQRVHVTPYIYQNPQKFQLLSVECEVDYSHYRWTVDTEEDLTFVQAVYNHFDPGQWFNWQDILTLMEQEPELLAMNQYIQQKSLDEG